MQGSQGCGGLKRPVGLFGLEDHTVDAINPALPIIRHIPEFP